MGRNNNDWMQLLDVPLKLMEYQLEEKKAQAEMAQYQQTSALAQQKQNAENQINMMKQGYSQEHFIELCRYVAENTKMRNNPL